MRAATTIAPFRMEVRDDLPEPSAGAGEALVAVGAVGICGSDLHGWTGHHPYMVYPRVQGHEFGGTILAVGPGSSSPLREGDAVAVEPLLTCGRCLPCRRGRGNACVHLRVLGAHVDGALTERVVVPIERCYPVTDLDAAESALVEPISIGMQAVERSGLGAADRAVILGAGPIGLAILLCALDRGAEVALVDRVPARLALGSELGAARTVDAASHDVHAVVGEWTDGEGPLVVFEATGVPALLRDGVDMVASTGTVVVVGLSEQEAPLPILAFTRKEMSVIGSRNNAGRYPASVDLVRRERARVKRLVSHRFPLADAATAFGVAAADQSTALKVIVEIGEDRRD